jgi:hypothetical protein
MLWLMDELEMWNSGHYRRLLMTLDEWPYDPLIQRNLSL